MRRSFLLLGAFVTLTSAASAAPPAEDAAGGLPACLEDRAAAEAEIDGLTAALEAANAKIDALAKENEALRAAALPSPFALADVLDRVPLGGGDALDREILGELSKAFGPVATAAADLDLDGAILTVDDGEVVLHLLRRDGKGNLRSGSTFSCTPGGTKTCVAPKIELNP